MGVEAFCNDAEGWGPISDARTDLTLCVENTILIGLPALMAIVVSVFQTSHMWRSGHPHRLGRTNVIYWPSQALMLGSAVALIVRAALLKNDDYAPATVFGSIIMAIAWLASIMLNYFQHLQEIRSNNTIFTLYIFSTITSAITIRTMILLKQTDQDQFKAFIAFVAINLLGFIVEAWPRGRTDVQCRSGGNRYDKANLFSRLTFQYMQPIVSAGFKRPLTSKDIVNMMPERSKAKFSHDRLNDRWQANVNKHQARGTKPDLFWTVMGSFGWAWVPMMFFRIVASTLTYVLPLLLNEMLSFIESYQSPNPQPVALGIILACGMFFASILNAVCMEQFFRSTVNVSVEARTALIAMVYRKSLKLSGASKQKFTTGGIINHMSVDAERFDISFPSVPNLISTPYEICIAIWMLYQQISWSVFVGVAFILIAGPVNGALARITFKQRSVKMEATDDRVRLTNEVLSGMKVIKLYGWDESFRQRINMYRRRELVSLRKIGITFSFMSIMFQSIPLLVSLVSFAVYATHGGPNFGPGEITPQRIFVSISLFTLLTTPIAAMSRVVGDTIALKVSASRIQKFLLAKELSGTATEAIETLPEDPSVPLIEIKNGVFAWDPEEPEVETEKEKRARERQEAKKHKLMEKEARLAGKRMPEKEVHIEKDYGPTLVDINLAIAHGEMTAIVGRVGQGKTSLLNAIIGDMYRRQGSVRVYGRLAYVPQQTWIINATLKDNIIFGNAFDQTRYDRVLMASGLLPDIAMLPAGDQTEIGERGINLSGGQKQRVSLARAAYEDADVYLFDDPLSAVDAHVDQHLWQHLIGPTGLLKDKARVLVTHAIHHLEQTDQVIVMKDGKIAELGKYETLLNAKNSLYQLIRDFSVKRDVPRKENEEKVENNGDEDTIHADGTERETTPDVKEDDKAELIAEEKMEEGSVSWNVYKNYAKAASYRYSFLVIFLFALGQGLQIGTNIWLEYWTSVSGSGRHTIGEFLGVYAALIFAYMVINIGSSYIAMVIAALRASAGLHERLSAKILRLPMSFFDTTPLGRIVNRFSMDIFSVDEVAPWNFIDVILCLDSILGTMIVIATTTPVFLALVVPVAALYILTQTFYMRTSRQLKRIDSVSRSPIYQHFEGTLSGVTTIRALRANERFIFDNAAKTDISANALYSSYMINRWLQFRLDSLGAVIVLGAALSAVVSRNSLNSGNVGLALSYALSFTQMSTNLVRSYCNLQNQLVAVERIEEYANKNTEAPAETDVILPEGWPQAGHVEFRNYSARYRQGLDLVVKNVSFEVQPAEKVGICGRTGAGKSSLTLALFRIIEAANSHWAKASDNGADMDADPTKATRTNDLENIEVEEDGGSIWVDGVDISTVGLSRLRQHLAIIPQDPILFQGTLRENLDPFEELQDAELWEALERAHLKEHISTLPGGLSFKVSQNGDNFSVGQRSLICLARALLRKSKVLLLDEATAAVDVETDELIQATIRKEFKDRTTLTIAHRIKTIMDSDKILVLEKGRVEEFESPQALLRRPNSLFYQLARQAGEI